MAEQIRSNRTSYESSLSPQQKELLGAVEIGSLDEVKRLLDGLSNEAKQEKWFDYVLVTTALEKGHEAVIDFLLESGCRVKTDTKTQFLCTPLYYAVEQNNAKIVWPLKRKGASVYDSDVNEKTPLELAMQNERFKLVNELLSDCRSLVASKNWDPNCKYDVALFHMVCHQYDSTVPMENLLKRGFSVHSRSTFDKDEWKGFTPLHFTLANSYSRSLEASVEVLLKYGADILAQDENGRTPVHVAFRNKSQESCSPFHTKFFKNWMTCLNDSKFNNLQDKNGLDFFHMICSGNDDQHDVSNYVDAIQSFLDNGVNINNPVFSDDPDYPGYTALHFAVKSFRFDLAKLLLKNGADVKKSDRKGLTPLHVACDYLSMRRKTSSISLDKKPSVSDEDRVKIVNLLLDHGADVDAKDLEGGTPIHYAFYSRGGNKTLARLLMQKSQLSCDLIDQNGLSYLHIASCLDLSAVETLIKSGASIHSRVNSGVSWETLYESGYSALHFAVSYNNLEIVRYLLHNGADSNIKTDDGRNTSSLHIASTPDIPELNDYMLETDPPAALQSYVSDRSNIIKLLIKHGASVNDKSSSGKTPLLIACEIPIDLEEPDSDSNFFTKCPCCEDSDSDSSRKDQSEATRKPPKLTDAVLKQLYAGQCSTIKILLQHGADIHARTNENETILHQITGQGEFRQKKKLAEMMLKKGVDPNVTKEGGLSPLHYVIMSYMSKRSDLSLFHLFCKYGANINANFYLDGTPLHYVAENCDENESEYELGHRKIIQYILDHPDADLNVQNRSGDTPLNVAAKERDEDVYPSYYWHRRSSLTQLTNHTCIEMLLCAGADIFIENSNGLSPFDRLYKWLMDNFPRYSSDGFCDRYYSRIFNCLITYFRRLPIMNICISDEVRKKFDALSQLRPEVAKVVDTLIDKEVERLKAEMISSSTSLYDILLKDSTELAQHVRDGSLKKIMESEKFYKDFFIFYGLLVQQFRRGLVRNSAENALKTVSSVSLPSSCSEHILRHLNSESLKNLIESSSVGKSFKRSVQNPSVHQEFQPRIRRCKSTSYWIDGIEMLIILKKSMPDIF